MNREILFKAKRKDNNEWVYGCGIYNDGVIAFIVNYDVNLIKETSKFEETQVIPETISQYTGLDDKNGKKIFENDIVKNHCNYKAIVKFGEYEYGFGSGNEFSIKHCGFYIQDIEFNDVFNLWGNGCEVIGNIFDKEE